MLAGDPSATWQVILDPLEGGHMPADLDGFAPPPGRRARHLHLPAWGWDVPLSDESGFGHAGKHCPHAAGDYARRPATAPPVAAVIAFPSRKAPSRIDSLADRLMFRLAYRNFIDHESLVVSHSVDPGIAGVVSGVRWYDFRISGQPDAVCSTYPCTYQQGTIADVPNGRSRWMPSISMDGAENILVGYSATGTVEATDAHSIRYTGRAKSDPLGTMTGPETIISYRHPKYSERTDRLARALGRLHQHQHRSLRRLHFLACERVLCRRRHRRTANWRTRIASASFPAGSGAGQCQPTTCTTRPTERADYRDCLSSRRITRSR